MEPISSFPDRNPERIDRPAKNNRYQRIKGESTEAYMDRILEMNRILFNKFDYLAKFIDFIVQDKKVFKKVIKELPTLKIPGLLRKVFQKNDQSQLAYLISEKLKRNELDLLQVEFIQIQFDNMKSTSYSQKDYTQIRKVREKLEDFEKRAYENPKEIIHPTLADNGLCLDFINFAVKGQHLQFLVKSITQSEIPFLNTEMLIAALIKGSLSLAANCLENCTPEQLRKAIEFTRLNNRNQINQIKVNASTGIQDGEVIYSYFNLTIYPNESALDIVARQGNIKFLEYLVDIINRKGDEAFKTELKRWIARNPYVKMIQCAQNVEELNQSLTLQQKFIHYPTKSENLVAKHSPQSKLLRQKQKRAIKEYLDAILEAGKLDSVMSDSALIAKIESNPKTERFIFQLKNEQGIFDQYEIVRTGNWFGVRGEYIVIKNKREKSLFHKNLSVITQELLSQALNGNRLEIVNLDIQKTITKDHHKDSNYWNDWNTGNEWELYVQLIHPVLSDFVTTLLKNQRWNSSPVIMDLCGGTGHLANRILRENQILPIDYILLENNQAEIRLAKTLLRGSASVVQTDVVNDPIFFKDELKNQPIIQESVDIAIGSGALTVSVLESKEVAREVLKKIHYCLKRGGHIVLAGFATSFIDSRDLKEFGFEVYNTQMPGQSRELYIARKI